MNSSAHSSDLLPEDGYEVVSLRANWGGMSMLLFAFSLFAPYLARFLVRTLQVIQLPSHLVWIPPVFVCSLLGTLFGLVGYRQSVRKGASQGLAKMGLVLNGFVFSLMLLFTLIVFLILGIR